MSEKYRITIEEVISEQFLVEAASKEEAIIVSVINNFTMQKNTR